MPRPAPATPPPPPIRTARGAEYAVFAQVTHRLKAIDEADRAAFPRSPSAVADNQRLWGTLAEDLMRDGNAPAGRRCAPS